MAGQGLSMNANGRLTAPPQVEVALVTNSVCGMVFRGAFKQLSTRGIPLDTSSFGPDSCHVQGTGRVRADRGIRGFGQLSQLPQLGFPSVPTEAVASN
jgi:hypothetical protein